MDKIRKRKSHPTGSHIVSSEHYSSELNIDRW